jgi:hypothetical protein
VVVARFELDNGALVLRLSELEKLGGLHADVRVPLAMIAEVRVAADPWSELRGIRAPGTGIPGVIALGTRLGSGTSDFVAVYHHDPAVVVETSGGEFDRLVVTSSEAAANAEMIRQAILTGTR